MSVLLDIPNDVFYVLFEYFHRAELLSSVTVCTRWLDLIENNSQLLARMDIKRAVYVFNQKGHYGVEFVTQRVCMIPDTPQGIASWLYTTNGLSKRQIAEYLGEKPCKETLNCFMSLQRFNGQHLEDSLRQCLNSVSLPSTTGQMKRILKGFARRYVECNPQYFKEGEYPAGV
eukprot:TRINITY_DN47043_c0_g1_i2.p1 TRINITY_DN47043_c0_g1~~TRINITY_DN47043_c0_g1_i2.p1  ORF type:complete len:173 (-),score=21.04 TRINITY_DN47043_c0_g1_i2:227-745(-)